MNFLSSPFLNQALIIPFFFKKALLLETCSPSPSESLVTFLVVGINIPWTVALQFEVSAGGKKIISLVGNFVLSFGLIL